MAGPWEKYQSPGSTSGPWAKYQSGVDYGGGLPTDSSPIDYARVSMSSAAQAAPAEAETPQQPSRNPSAGEALLESIGNMFAGGQQGTNPNVYDGDGQSLRRVLGPVTAEGDMGLYYRGQDGRDTLVDPKSNVVLVDPASGRPTVYERDPDWDEGRLSSLSRVALQGHLTGPVAGVPRAVAGANATRSAIAAGRAQNAVRDAEAFNNLNVRPFGPSFASTPVAGTAKQLADTPFIGAPIQNALEESITGARNAATDIAGRFGAATDARQGGEAIEAGISRFKDARPADVVEDAVANLPDAELSRIIAQPAGATSLKTKQGALYERAWRQIPEEMRAGRAVEGDPRVMSNPSATRAVLQDIGQRNRRMTIQTGANAAPENIGRPVQGGLLGRMIEAVENPRWTANLQTLRNMRSEFRRLASGMGDTEKNTLKLSDLDRIQSAITRDMIGQLQRNAMVYRSAGNERAARGFERAIREFARADRFTALSMQRMETIERLFRAESAEQLARNVTNAALSGGRGNLQMLRTLQRTLRPEEMGEVAASVISELGRPVASARGHTQEIGFSVGSFLTRWRNMSPEARGLLFRGEHRRALDDLERVVSRLANVEALANTSRSATNAASLGGLLAAGGSYAAGGLEYLLGSLAAGAGASAILSRPQYVRWATGWARIRAAGARAPQSRVIAHINRLAEFARRDPGLSPILQSLRAEIGIGEGADGDDRKPKYLWPENGEVGQDQ